VVMPPGCTITGPNNKRVCYGAREDVIILIYAVSRGDSTDSYNLVVTQGFTINFLMRQCANFVQKSDKKPQAGSRLGAVQNCDNNLRGFR
jgi:hypothetical protein